MSPWYFRGGSHALNTYWVFDGTLGYAGTSIDSIYKQSSMVSLGHIRPQYYLPLLMMLISPPLYLEKAHAIKFQRQELVARAALQKDVLVGIILSGILFC